MNLIDYGHIILRRGWIAILLAILAAVAAFGFSQVVTPVYRGTQTVLLVPSRVDLGLAEALLRLINNRQAYLNSTVVSQEIINDLQLDLEPSYLLGKTTFVTLRDSFAIQIDVDLPEQNHDQIGLIVTAWAQELIDFQNQQNQSARQEDRIIAQIQDNPRVFLLRPDKKIYTAIGGIGGLFLGVILIFLLEYFESNIIRRPEDVETALNLKVLAAVPTD